MKKRQTILGLALGLLGLAAGYFGYLEMIRARTLRIKLRDSERSRNGLYADISAESKRNAWLEKQASELKHRLGRLSAAHPGAEDSERPIINDEREWSVYGDPKLINLHLNTFRSQLVFRYSQFYQTAGLSADQIARFEEIQTEAEGHLRDIELAAEALGYAQKGAEVAPLVADNEAQLSAEELDLLGRAGMESLQSYEQSAPERQLLDRLDTALLFTDSPMSGQQTAQLTQIITAAGKAPSDNGPDAVDSIDFDQVQTRTAALLTPTQSAELGSSIARVKADRLAYQMMGMMNDWAQAKAAGRAP